MPHDHDHDHGSGHGHSHAPASFGFAFAIGVTLNLGYIIAEFIFGRLANSIALMADAGHNLGDVLGLAVAWGATVLAKRQPTAERTYGWRRSSILAALANAVVLLITVGAIAWEAVRRLSTPGDVAGITVIWVAVAGVLVNGVTAYLFQSGRKGDLNIRAAFAHMAADAGLALGVALAGVVILFTGWVRIDPIVSLVLVVVIVRGTWGLLKDSVNLAMDAVPGGIDLDEIQQYFAGLPSVNDVHDLHIWGMSTTETALTVHLVTSDRSGGDRLLAECCTELHDRFGIEHATLQLEQGDPVHPCRLASPQVV